MKMFLSLRENYFYCIYRCLGEIRNVTCVSDIKLAKRIFFLLWQPQIKYYLKIVVIYLPIS